MYDVAFEDNAGICQLKELLKICAFHQCFRPNKFWSFWLFFFFMSKICFLSKLTLFNFRCQKISFLCKHNLFTDEKYRQWNLDNKVIVFHESISCLVKCS